MESKYSIAKMEQETKELLSKSKVGRRKRITMEVMEDVGEVPKVDLDGKTMHQRVKTAEDHSCDAFGFEQETKRIQIGKDSFMPSKNPEKRAVVMQQKVLEEEQKRLLMIKQKILDGKMDTREKKEKKRNRIVETHQQLAATKIQNGIRRRMAYKRVGVLRKRKVLQEEFQKEWRVIRNVEKNEIWYYNTKTKRSQWEVPKLEDSLPSIGNVSPSRKNQSNVDGNSSFTSLPKLQGLENVEHLDDLSSRPPSTMRSERSNEEENAEFPELPKMNSNSNTPQHWAFTDDRQNAASAQMQPDRSLKDTDDDGNYFLADGSRSVKLKQTIQKQLRQSKFDSISKLLVAHTSPSKGRMQNANNHMNDELSDRQVIMGRRKGGPFMVAQLKGKKTKKRNKALGMDKPKNTSLLKSIPTIRHVDDPGFEPSHEKTIDDQMEIVKNNKNVEKCFGCWIARNGGKCESHKSNKTRVLSESESILLCSNWEVDQMRRKYRAEEIQEVFEEQNTSLRYDTMRKTFVTVKECKHPIYRYTEQTKIQLNKTMRRKVHARAWIRSFLDILRTKRSSQKDRRKSVGESMLRLKTTMINTRSCQVYSDEVVHLRPVPPITQIVQGTYTQGQEGLGILFVDQENTPPTKVLPTTVCEPVKLYQPRAYEIPPSICVPIPDPDDVFKETIPLPVQNSILNPLDKTGWFERLSYRTALAATLQALSQVAACSPLPGLDSIKRTKHPPPAVVKFATFGRKPTPDGKAVGGFAAEMTVHMLVTTYVPPQYGNFSVTHIASINPGSTKDEYKPYVCISIAMEQPIYVYRILVHSLNVRRPPGITISTISPPDDFHYYGKNRPEQTGEEEPHGFCTTFTSNGLAVATDTVARSFEPSADSMSPNLTATNQTITTRVDRGYPFCEASTNGNTVLDFLHLLWVGKSSRNQGQCFTNLGIQDPGNFMRKSDPNSSLGSFFSVVYRSWAYMQSSPYEEFVTNEGIAYWYSRTTGETYWERPILANELARGGDGEINGSITTGESEVPSLGVGCMEHKYSQGDIRKYITKSLEEPKQEVVRIRNVTKSAVQHNIKPPRVEEKPVHKSEERMVDKLKIPPLSITSNKRGNSPAANPSTSKQPSDNSNSIRTKTGAQGNSKKLGPTPGGIDPAMLQNITAAINTVLQQSPGSHNASSDMLQLGIGLGMGLGLQNPTQPVSRPGTATSVLSTQRPSTAGEPLNESDETSRTLDTDRSDSSIGSVEAMNETVLASATPDEEPSAGQSDNKDPNAEYTTHSPAGKNVTWVELPSNGIAMDQTIVPGTDGLLHKSVACLPVGFVESISSSRCVSMHADYLPRVVNMNEARTVGVVRPRTVASDWLSVGYDPWSSGREIFNTQHLSSISLKEDDVSTEDVKDPFKNKEALEAQQQHITKAAKEIDIIHTLFSLCRRGSYAEIEEQLHSPDWVLPIDAIDENGNTLLSIAAQNNMKRIVKLCLRRGADIDTQNANGQTPLHFCYAYQYDELATYLLDKGANDTITNADNLTCYEGLSLEELENL